MDSQPPAKYPDVFGLLSQKSLAKIKAVKSEAEAALLPALSRTIESIAVNMDGLIEHDPSEFFPAFERYTERQYDGYAEGLLPHFPDVTRYVWLLAGDVTDRISTEIRPELKFVRKNGLLEEWAQSRRPLQDSDPEGWQEVSLDLSVSSGEWETYIERCFVRHMLKYAGPNRRLGDAEFEQEIEHLCMLFRLKYKFYFRRSTNWSGFDTRLRAHLSNRLAHWKAEADKRAVSQADDVAADEPAPPDTTLPNGENSPRTEAGRQ